MLWNRINHDGAAVHVGINVAEAHCQKLHDLVTCCLSEYLALTGGCFLEMCRRNLERLYLCLYVLFIIDFLFLVIQRTFFLEVFNLLLTPLLALCSS